ncbi:hypothetical protein PENSPDRAFT_654809 [Peniophora sp. CONT]|nr:hypothetical protein PENSPDRAFT_654809 [Peniophora sp. CONT]
MPLPALALAEQHTYMVNALCGHHALTSLLALWPLHTWRCHPSQANKRQPFCRIALAAIDHAVYVAMLHVSYYTARLARRRSAEDC